MMSGISVSRNAPDPSDLSLYHNSFARATLAFRKKFESDIGHASAIRHEHVPSLFRPRWQGPCHRNHRKCHEYSSRFGIISFDLPPDMDQVTIHHSPFPACEHSLVYLFVSDARRNR